MSYTNGHKKFDGLSITSIGFAIASGVELPADIALRVDQQAESNAMFHKALEKEIARWQDEFELARAIATKPRLARMLQMQGHKRGWRKLAEFC